MKVNLKNWAIGLLALLVMNAGFTACSDDDDDDNGGKNKDLVGTWKVVQYYYEEIEDGEIVNSKNNSGDIFTINEDGTSDFDCAIGEPCKWSYQGGKLHFHWTYEDEGETDDMTYTVEKLTSEDLIMEWNEKDTYDGVKVEIHEKYVCKKISKDNDKEEGGSGEIKGEAEKFIGSWSGWGDWTFNADGTCIYSYYSDYYGKWMYEEKTKTLITDILEWNWRIITVTDDMWVGEHLGGKGGTITYTRE